MYRSRIVAVLTSAILTVGVAWGQTKAPRPPASPTNIANAAAKPRPAATPPGPVVTPATVNFAATNPGTLPSVLGSPITTFTYGDADFPGGGTGELTVSATGFTGGAACGNIPVSAVTVTCASAQSSLSCASAACIAGSPQLNAAGVPIATGTLTGTCDPNFTVTLNYNFADNWKYTAETCTLILTYNVVIP